MAQPGSSPLSVGKYAPAKAQPLLPTRLLALSAANPKSAQTDRPRAAESSAPNSNMDKTQREIAVAAPRTPAGYTPAETSQLRLAPIPFSSASPSILPPHWWRRNFHFGLFRFFQRVVRALNGIIQIVLVNLL